MSDCIECIDPTSLFNGTCVPTNSTNGICDGSNGSIIVDNSKQECDSKNLPPGKGLTSINLLACPATCEIPDFSPITSTIGQLQCVGCLLGFFLSNTWSCPVGTSFSLLTSTDV